MHHRSKPASSSLFIVSLGIIALATIPLRAEIAAPYSPDGATLHLWHFDEAVPPVIDFGSNPTNFTNLGGGATLNNPSLTGFGTALSTLDGGQGDVTGPGRDAVFSTRAPYNGTPTSMTYADPVTGAFTFEAIVKIGFDPAANMGTTANGGNNRNAAMQIFTLESNTAGGRVAQFRIDPRGFNPNAGGFTTPLPQPAIEFVNVHLAVAPVENFIALIPTEGPEAIVSNGWYHVAVTYNGMPNTDNNLNFYWTPVESSRSNATLLASFKMINNLSVSATPNPCFGNIGRTAGNNFLGLIDEFRISRVARSASGMLFASTNVGIDTEPVPQTVAVGQTASFSVTASGLPPYTYQWLHEGTNLVGATQSVYTVTSAQLSHAGAYQVIVSNNFTAATSIVATLTVRVASNLVWTGQSGLDWDFATANWIDSDSAPAIFSIGDHVRFDAVGAGGGGFVNMTTNLSPSSVTVDADSDYTFLTFSDGKLAGTSKLTKSGTGTLIIENDNSYTGPTVINSGTLHVGAVGTPTAKGSFGSGPVTNNGALVFNRTGSLTLVDNYSGTGTLQNNGALALNISGTNTSTGDIILNAGSLNLSTPQAHGNFTSVVLNASLQSTAGTRLSIGGGSSYGANVALSMLGTSAAPDLRTVFAGTGGTNAWNGPIALSGSGVAQIAAESADGTFLINGPITGDELTGSLLFRGNGTGIISGTITLPNASVNRTDGGLWIVQSTGNFWTNSTFAAATVRIGANNALPTGLTLTLGQAGSGTANLDLGGFNQQIATLKDGGGNEFIGNSSTVSDSTFTLSSAGSSSFGGNIIDAFTNGTRRTALTLTGGGVLTLRSNNTFSGETTIANGTLALTGAGAIPNTLTINQSAGTTFDVSGRTGGSITLGAAQKLKGNGAFTVLGSLVNNGTIELKINKSGATLSNDSLQGLTQITYGGTLSLVASGNALTVSDSFKLFTATTYAGAFVSITPSAPTAGLSWDTSTLVTDGTLRIKSGPNETPTDIVATVSGNVLKLAWPEDHIGFRLQAQTNSLNVGLSNNWFDVTGSTATNQVNLTIDPTQGTVFYRLVYP